MFGWIKNPFARKEDYSGIKDHMLGDSSPSRISFERPSFEREMNPQRRAIGDPDIDPSLRPAADFRAQGSPAINSYGLRKQRIDDEDIESRGILSDDEEFSGAGARRLEKKLDMDKVVNTLLLIKEQLAAIKAQNEMINERLKNLERIAGSETY